MKQLGSDGYVDSLDPEGFDVIIAGVLERFFRFSGVYSAISLLPLYRFARPDVPDMAAPPRAGDGGTEKASG